MALQCLIIARERATAEMLSTLLIEAGVSPTVYDEAEDAFATLQEVKFDAVFLDAELEGALSVVPRLRREATPNRTAIVMVVSASDEQLRAASHQGADLVLRQQAPLELARKTVQLARSLMATERRRYFRHPVEGFAELRLEKESVPAHITNISEGGLALHCRHELQVGARLEIEFYLPEQKGLVHARAIVAWVKPAQRAGLRFENFLGGSRTILDAWLAAQAATLGADLAG